MNIGRIERTWIGLGVISAVVIAMAGWFLFVSPQQARTSTLQSQVSDAQLRSATLESKLASLSQENVNLPQYELALAHDQAALPAVNGLPNFLREVQAVGASTLVQTSKVQANPPVPVTANGAPVGAAPTAVASGSTTGPAKPTLLMIQVTVDAIGSPTQLTSFIDQLQSVQSRAVLIIHAVLGGNTGCTCPAATGAISLQLTMNLFVEPSLAGTAN
jgi:hypothetical protein